MKLILTVLVLCSITLLNSNLVHGGLIKNVFEKVHDTAHKVREDVRSVFLPEKHEQEHSVENENTDFKPVTESNSADVNYNNDKSIKKEEDQKSSSIGLQDEHINANKNTVEENTEINSDGENKDSVQKDNTEAKVNGQETAGKDGRENFTGGCATGYQRTSDGRCKPTY